MDLHYEHHGVNSFQQVFLADLKLLVVNDAFPGV